MKSAPGSDFMVKAPNSDTRCVFRHMWALQPASKISTSLFVRLQCSSWALLGETTLSRPSCNRSDFLACSVEQLPVSKDTIPDEWESIVNLNRLHFGAGEVRCPKLRRRSTNAPGFPCADHSLVHCEMFPQVPMLKACIERNDSSTATANINSGTQTHISL